MVSKLKIPIVDKCEPFITSPARYIVAKGGRGSGKTHSIGRASIIRSMQKPTRFLCTRLLQNSIAESVHKLLTDIIEQNNLSQFFTITQTSIKNVRGSEFIFKGLHNNINEIKSLEGVDICWVEEAQAVSKRSWDTLIPTIRTAGSQIWVSYNPNFEDDYTHKLFTKTPPDDCVLVELNYEDNPWFPKELELEMEQCKRNDYDAYLHIWRGECRRVSDAQVFKGKYKLLDFEPPHESAINQGRFFLGIDFGFSQDPCAANKMFIRDNCLYISHEANGKGIENDYLEQWLLEAIPDVKRWHMYGDAARPETISHLARRGFQISAADKWKGSVEDGVSYLKGFDMIYIHPRCKNTLEEFNRYSYKVDKNTEEVLPTLEDRNNHHIDAIRYGLSSYIKQSGTMVRVGLKGI